MSPTTVDKIMDLASHAPPSAASSPDDDHSSTGLTLPGAWWERSTLGQISCGDIAAVAEAKPTSSLGAVFYEMAPAQRHFAGTTKAGGRDREAVLSCSPTISTVLRPEFPRAIARGWCHNLC